jgi:hypothetical protein
MRREVRRLRRTAIGSGKESVLQDLPLHGGVVTVFVVEVVVVEDAAVVLEVTDRELTVLVVTAELEPLVTVMVTVLT